MLILIIVITQIYQIIYGNNTKDDIKYLVIDEYCILYNKTKNKFSYCKNSSVENKKLNVYIDGNYYGIYNLKYGTVWNLFDDNKEYVNYEGSLLAYSDGLNLENVSFIAEDFNSQYITEANNVLNNSKVNVKKTYIIIIVILQEIWMLQLYRICMENNHYIIIWLT